MPAQIRLPLAVVRELPLPSFHLDRRASDIADALEQGGHPDDLLTTKEVARIARNSTQWWEILRSKGGGPPFVRMSPRCIRYRRADLVAWCRERTYLCTAKYADSHKPMGRKKGSRVVNGGVLPPLTTRPTK